MDKAIWPLTILVLASVVLSVSVQGLIDDYDDIPYNSTVGTNGTIIATDATNATRNDTYPVIAKRLNCAKLVLRHKGVKTEEVRSEKIIKPQPIARIAVSTPKSTHTSTSTTTQGPPSPGDEFTIPPELFEGGDVPGSMSIPPGKENIFGLPEDEVDPIAALLAGEDAEEPDPIAALLAQESGATSTSTSKPTSTSTSKPQQGRKLASGHDQNQLKSTPVNRQGTDAKNGTAAKVDTHAVNSTMKHKNGTNATVLHECDFAFDGDGGIVLWYEVIARNGGLPGAVNATKLTPKKTKVLEPCNRPITSTTPPAQDLLYEYELFEYEKVLRREKAYRRFSGTASEFVDVIGQMVWAPPGFERRYFRLHYRKDDTGFYVTVRRRQKCVFEKKPPSVSCTLVHDFTPCANNSTLRSLSPGLQASLIG